MACFFPLAGYYSKEVNPSGKRSIVFDKRKSFSGVQLQIPCGECIGCRMVESRNWAIRCMHEKRCSAVSEFITLTYDDDHLPSGGSLVKEHVQLFMKRLRASHGEGIRFFGCGEYGTHTLRPHYHLLLFNCHFPDRRRVGETATGDPLYRSADLGRLWPVGNNIIGDVTFRSASYVAKYCVKKVGAPAPKAGCEPEFRLMSRRPGIGSFWLERFHREAYKSDSVIMDAREVPIPRFYDKKFELIDPKLLDRRKAERRAKARLRAPDNTHARRCVRERVEVLKARLFERGDV